MEGAQVDSQRGGGKENGGESRGLAGESPPPIYRGVRMDTKLASMCAAWLKEKFGREAEIIHVEVEERTVIDLILNTVAVKFHFIQEDGTEGEGVAFLDAHLIGQGVEPGLEEAEALS